MSDSEDKPSRAAYLINRQTFSQPEFLEEFEEISHGRLTWPRFLSSFKKLRLQTFGFEMFPFLRLRLFYNLHGFFLDIIAGLTMGIFHIPQGMAYGALAGLRPVNGLYTSFFPVIAYFFFTTSRHNSVGTFSIASLLFSAPINRITSQYMPLLNSTQGSSGMTDAEYNFRLSLALTLTFSIGILQILMALCQIGFLVTYLSGPLISGFMCATAFHVVASQFNALFGIMLPRVYGIGNLLIKTYNLFANITKTNPATIVISIVCLGILHLFRIVINPKFRKRFKFPIPIELLIVILSTVMSYFIGFADRWDVLVVGTIPKGLPAPVLPKFNYFTELLPDIFVLGIVTFAINASLVKTYASELGYDVLDNQELFSLGISNTFASFFQCHAACGALGRTAVVVAVGMTSQIASLISCGLLLIVLYFLGPYFYALPKAVLSTIVMVSLTSTFKKVLDLKRLWAVSKIDTIIWLVSFIATIALDVPFGLVIGVVFTVLTVVYRSQCGGRHLLGAAKDTGLYSDIRQFENLDETPGIKIVRYDGPVYFASVESFQKAVYHLSGLNAIEANRQLTKMSLSKDRKNTQKISKNNSPVTNGQEVDQAGGESLPLPHVEIASVDLKDEAAVDEPSFVEDITHGLKVIILDASGWMFTDTVGLRGIKELIKQYASLDLTIFIAGLRPRLRRIFQNSGVFALLPEDNFFMSIHDAVLVARVEMGLDAAASDVIARDDEAATAGANYRTPDSFIPRKISQRKLTRERLQSVDQTDPDAVNDLSVLGEEVAGRL